jgi:hypothetical protein
VSDALSQEYNGAEASLFREVDDFITELKELGLVTDS